MPIYEYACVECGHHFEQYRKVSERQPRRCPQCRGRVKKVFRPVGIIFKGSGFHVTDYRKPEKKEAGAPKRAGAEPKKETAGSGSPKGGDSD
jgi:putative FmdB family regulatory protein